MKILMYIVSIGILILYLRNGVIHVRSVGDLGDVSKDVSDSIEEIKDCVLD
jgi:hypothetical protein